jgi:hypothetical protein
MPNPLLIVTASFFVVACSGSDEPVADASGSVGSSPASSAAAEADGGSCMTTVAHLASYLPRSFEGFDADVESFNSTGYQDDRPVDEQASLVSISYGEVRDYRAPVTVKVVDLAQHDRLRSSIAATVDSAQDADDHYTSVERHHVDGLGRVHYAVSEDGSEAITLLSEDDMMILINKSAASGLDALLEAIRSSSLAPAVTRNCAGMQASMPAWLTPGTTAVAAEPEPTRDGAVLASLPACDAILPPATVAEICGVDATVARPTSFETEGENCNRHYRLPEQGGGVVFMVSNYRNYQRAGSAVKAGSVADDEYAKDVSQLPELGQGGERYLHDVTSPTYTVRFASHGALVEIKNADSLWDGPAARYCLDLDKLQAIGEAADENLAEHAN